MPVTDAYATVNTYRAIIDKSDVSEDGEIHDDLVAVSRYLDEELGRFFTQESAAARRFIPPTSRIELAIDDLVSITSLLTDDNGDGAVDTAWAATDYQLRPLNAALGPEVKPYTRIVVPPWSTKSAFIGGRLITITGTWGWPAVPKAIERATVHLAAIVRLETPRAQATVSEIGQLVQMSPQARGIVEKLARVYSRKAVAV